MASDISLAVGDGARRMTYAEIAAVRGISPASAKRLAQRHRWGRQVGNDGITRVTVPLAFLQKALVFRESDKKAVSPMTGVTEAMTPPGVADDIADDVAPVTTALARAVDSLREQLVIANGRADRAEARADKLQAELTEERRRVIAILTDDRRRPWWRRWFR